MSELKPLIIAFACSFVVLWAVAEMGAWLRPWDDYDKACMSQTVQELATAKCINDVKHKKYGK